LVLDFIGIAIYSYDGKAEFSASLDWSLVSHLIFQKSFWYACLLLKKHFLLQMLKTVVLL